AHYFMNNAFLEENQIIKNADKLEGIPGVIVHGRYDMVCPLDNAFALHKVWPDAELQIIREAGHASREVGIVDALIRATDAMDLKLTPETDHLASQVSTLRSIKARRLTSRRPSLFPVMLTMHCEQASPGPGH